jgi:hypothetical protein
MKVFVDAKIEERRADRQRRGFRRESRYGAGARARNPQGRDADHRQLREKGGGLYQADRRARVPRLGLTVFPGRATIREKAANASAG